MYQKLVLAGSVVAALGLLGCQDHRIPATTTPVITATMLTAGLKAPIGVDIDAQGRLWVSEIGTGHNDGQVSMITPDGTVYPAIVGFDSQPLDGDLDGLNHLLFADGLLYILGSHSRLYTVNVASFQAGSPPIQASSLTPEDMRAFIVNYAFLVDPSRFLSDTDDTHLFNMTLGPDGALYFTDAAANAIIRRAKTGAWSIVTQVPGVANPTPVGPPRIESVPTGITFNGTDFFVGTLLGFPFPADIAFVDRLNLSGSLTTYQKGFTSLIDLENDGNGGILALQHGVFGSTGFAPNTGQLLRANGTSSTVLVDKLNLPTDLKVVDSHTAYLTSLSGTLTKLSF